MCTLIAFSRVWDDAPLVLALNRDEAYDRPSSPPAWSGHPPVLAPRDERAGGTWMGATAAGLWVGLTNRGGPADPTRRSRGLLCRDLLAEPDALGVLRAVERRTEPTNPFNLVAGDPDGELRLIEAMGGRTRTRELGAGCHVVTNRPFDETADEPKVVHARRLLKAAGLWPRPPGGPAPADLVSTLAAILADHGREGDDAICLHGGRSGTRSAAVWRLGGSPAVELAFADGPPCSAPFVPAAGGAA